MKVTGVTSKRKWLQTPGVVSLWQDVADTNTFEFQKEPDRLMEEELIEDCHVQRSASGSPKLDIAG